MKYQICFDITSGNNHFLHHIEYCQSKQEYYIFLSMKSNDLKRINEYFRQFGLKIELSLQQQEFIFYGNKVTLDPEKENQELAADQNKRERCDICGKEMELGEPRYSYNGTKDIDHGHYECCMQKRLTENNESKGDKEEMPPKPKPCEPRFMKECDYLTREEKALIPWWKFW